VKKMNRLVKNKGTGKSLGHGRGRGKNNGGGFGIGGYCVCMNCNEKVPHQRGVKCTSVKCPKCGHTMMREELLNKK
jgi:ribosomal protein S26